MQDTRLTSTCLTIGIDLAKNVFQVHGVDERSKIVLKKQVKRAQMASFFVNLPPCLIGMDALVSKVSQMPHSLRKPLQLR